jgi:hypothetical protein
MSEERPIIFEHCPKYHTYELSEEQIVKIARKAVELSKEEFYIEVGRSVTSKFLWLLGISAVGLFIWLKSHGLIVDKD